MTGIKEWFDEKTMYPEAFTTKWIDEKYMVDNFPVADDSRGDDHHSISMIRDTFLSRIKIDQ